MKPIILSFFAAIVLFIAAELYFSGAFKPVEIEVQTKGPYAILFKDHIGAYDKIVSTIEEVETWAKQNNLPCTLTFGEYLDDPHAVEQERLRSRGGCITSDVDSKNLATHSPLAGPLPSDFNRTVIEPKKYVVATFAGSPRIGPLKVYPKVNEYIAAHKLKQVGGTIEVYDIQPDNAAMTTTYLFPIE